MPGIADKFTHSAQDRLLWPGMTSFGSDSPDHRRREVFERRRAKLRHGVASLGAQDCKDALDTWLTESA